MLYHSFSSISTEAAVVLATSVANALCQVVGVFITVLRLAAVPLAVGVAVSVVDATAIGIAVVVAFAFVDFVAAAAGSLQVSQVGVQCHSRWLSCFPCSCYRRCCCV